MQKNVAMHNLSSYVSGTAAVGWAAGTVIKIFHLQEQKMVNKKTGEAADFPTFDVTTYFDAFREMAEKNIAQNAETYDNFKASAEEATASAQKAFEAMREGMTALSNKALENTKANTGASLAYMEKLAGVRNVSELIELQSAFFRNSLETMSTQAREAQEISVRLGEKTAAPVTAAAEKAVEKASPRAA
jgi:phasin